jgi:hypothetical protein
MIFTSESGLLDASREPEWDEWYHGHLAVMASVPGISSAQRFRTADPGRPPSLAMYSVASAAVFQSEAYLSVRGMGPFVSVVDERLHRRNLFAGLETAPIVPATSVLLVADWPEPGPQTDGIVWLRAVAIDSSVPYRGIGIFPDIAAARAVADSLAGAALYVPVTKRFESPDQQAETP